MITPAFAPTVPTGSGGAFVEPGPRIRAADER